ncbi:MAG: biotin/lipoyl-containing protein [Paracoccaceae bacterium]|uniref:biotin/lipoyl-containing protein n=1 Tax=Seohaeicola saemankumensis TaxID=481181 RepID=UPI001E4F0916|nr:biotin/lipoyl-containing protein [Seohaeicola saemankumensis]MCD1627027.1 pyruvate dehydrogenase [Seohaeicola saemankumensis]
MPRNDGPHDVTMPQLGMAQDAGKIVAWLKAAGDPVAKGDALFEVETDKATMEVEAQADGYLTGITAAEGEDVPVGAVIARISDSAEDDAPAPASQPKAATAPSGKAADAGQDLPEGTSVTMPQLGMAQDTGLLVSWQKALGDAVSADDVLFEVETDKSTMEVPAGHDGYLAATLAEEGDEVPVGAPVAIISKDKPDAPVARSAKATPPETVQPAETPAAMPPERAKERPVAPPPVPTTGDRILASPKARRVAMERGLDLQRLVTEGYAQPFHMSDLDTLAALPVKTPAGAAANAGAASIRLTAEIATDGFAAFAAWAAAVHGLTDADALLSGLAGASLDAPAVVEITRHGHTRRFAVPAGRALSAIIRTEDSPDLILRDLRGTALRSVVMGAEDRPVLTLVPAAAGLGITLECSADQIAAPDAITLLSAFAGRMEQPLRHLL